MSFDPNQFVINLAQGLGQQIAQGSQRARENVELDRILPQLQQAEDPNEILSSILQSQVNRSLLPETRKNLANLAPTFQKQAELQQKRKAESVSREGLINIAERTTNVPREELAKLDQTSLRQIAQRGLTGGARGSGAINVQDPKQATKDLKEIFGASDAEARTYLSSNPGVRTKLIEKWNREIDRGFREEGPRFNEAAQATPSLIEVDVKRTPTIDPVNVVGQFPETDLLNLEEKDFISEVNKAGRNFSVELPPWPRGLSQSEISKERKENLKANREESKELNENLKFLRGEGRDLNSLDKLNKTGDLPSGPTRLFQVDQQRGNVRPIATAFKATKPAAELYSKILNGFIRKARDFFGARVTNFELGAFLATLPTLLNTDEGRDVVLKQMRLVNRINRIEQKVRQNVLSKAQGRFSSLELQPEIDRVLVEQNQGLIDELNRVVERSQELASKGISEVPEQRSQKQKSVDEILFGDLG